MGVYSKKVDKLDKPIEMVKERAEALYREGDYLCPEAVFTVVNDYLGRPVPPEAVRMASGIPVGMGTAGCGCGALSGGVMALGLKFGRTQPKAETGHVRVAKQLHDEFKEKYRSACCRVLTKKHEFGSPEHIIAQCTSITGAVAEMVMKRMIASGKLNSQHNIVKRLSGHPLERGVSLRK